MADRTQGSAAPPQTLRCEAFRDTMRDDDIARAGNSAVDGGAAVTERNRHFWKRGGRIAERATTIDVAQGTPRSIRMPF